MRRFSLFAVLHILGLSQPLLAEVVHQLPLGDPERREQQLSLKIDSLIDSRNEDEFPAQGLPERLQDTQVVLIAEQHTSMADHQVQLRAIELLVAAGREVIIGLEMLPFEVQNHLNAWTRGVYSE